MSVSQGVRNSNPILFILFISGPPDEVWLLLRFMPIHNERVLVRRDELSAEQEQRMEIGGHFDQYRETRPQTFEQSLLLWCYHLAAHEADLLQKCSFPCWQESGAVKQRDSHNNHEINCKRSSFLCNIGWINRFEQAWHAFSGEKNAFEIEHRERCLCIGAQQPTSG
jgi:hypothetical protein